MGVDMINGLKRTLLHGRRVSTLITFYAGDFRSGRVEAIFTTAEVLFALPRDCHEGTDALHGRRP